MAQAREPSFKMSAARLGTLVLLASLTMLFAGTIIAYLVTRWSAPIWRSATLPHLPLGLLASTLILAVLAASQHRALQHVRKNRLLETSQALAASFVLALGFVVAQAWNWRSMAGAATSEAERSLYVFTFYLLTGVHALHVLGGLVPLGVVLARARRREYSSSRHEGIELCVLYWDFLAAVWLVLLGVLYTGT